MQVTGDRLQVTGYSGQVAATGDGLQLCHVTSVILTPSVPLAYTKRSCSTRMRLLWRTPLVQSFRELVVWQRARELASLLYRLTQQFPRDEIYGLTGQLRRAGISIASNIAEGSGR